MKIKHLFIAIILVLGFGISGNAQEKQTEERLFRIEERLRNLSLTVPGLNQRVSLSMSGASAQEFLRALAQSNGLNINIDPQVSFKIYSNFRNESASNILLFLAREHGLDINMVGSILSVSKVIESRSKVITKDPKVVFYADRDTWGLELQDDSLHLVAKKISKLSQKNIVVPVALMNKKVTVFIADAQFQTALDKLAYANGLKLNKTSDGVFIFEALVEGEELYLNGEMETAVKLSSKPMAPGGVGNYNISGRNEPGGKKLISINAIATPILDLVKSASVEANVNYFIYSEIKGTVTTRLNNISYENFLSALLQGTDYTYKFEGGVYLIGDRKLEGLRTSKMVKLRHRSLDTVQMMVPAEWRKGVEIKEFREQNTLLVSGPAPQVNEIVDYIMQIDKVVPMILIEVTLVDVRKGKAVKTGISAGVSDSVRTGGTIMPGIDYTFGANSINDLLSKIGGSGAINIGKVTPNFYVRLSALENNSNVDIRSVPKLATLNGHTATLSIGSSRFYSTETQNVIPSLNAQTVITQQFTEVNANLEIAIKPVVSGDDQVTLDIEVNISDFIGNPPLNAPPPKSTSKFKSLIRARNEDMIVLGGLERTESAETGSGIPLLSRIPILKWLFSSREKSNSKVVTLVFIKPVVMY
ncbi:MAG: general secretion pathway protein GspD [Pedobacter sp.]|nr:MAG: general secretion pathway protein GspD [Pedobacter sp.]